VKIVPMLIPVSNKYTRPGIAMSPKYITVHETDNTDRGANALAHAKLQQRGNDRQASWHFTVDSGDTIYQSIPTNEVSWNAGDGQGVGNLDSISFEMCVNSDGDFEQTKKNGAWLARYLMDKYHIPISHVVQHNHWSGKDCPRTIRAEKNGWDNFLSLIHSIPSKSPSKTSKPYPGYLIRYMDKGEIVKEIQAQLGGLVVDGIFGRLTDARVREFQKAHKLVTDGIVGPLTWNALFN
jgi:N-acetylmuramoyl-L-alanine amidase